MCIRDSFIPCGAKLPIIGLIAGAIFGNAGWVAWSAYFIGVAAIVISGIILKKTRMFAGEPAPFVLELPAYHAPTVVNVLRATWERGWSFIKKAGTIILPVSYTHLLLCVRDQFIRELAIGIERAVFIPLPRTQVHFINVHRLFIGRMLLAPRCV